MFETGIEKETFNESKTYSARVNSSAIPSIRQVNSSSNDNSRLVGHYNFDLLCLSFALNIYLSSIENHVGIFYALLSMRGTFSVKRNTHVPLRRYQVERPNR